MLCVQQMNNIRNRAMEVVNSKHCGPLFYMLCACFSMTISFKRKATCKKKESGAALKTVNLPICIFRPG